MTLIEVSVSCELLLEDIAFQTSIWSVQGLLTNRDFPFRKKMHHLYKNHDIDFGCSRMWNEKSWTQIKPRFVIWLNGREADCPWNSSIKCWILQAFPSFPSCTKYSVCYLINFKRIHSTQSYWCIDEEKLWNVSLLFNSMFRGIYL